MASLFYSLIIEPIYKGYVGLNQQVRLKSTELAKNLRAIKENNISCGGPIRHSRKFVKGMYKEETALVLGELEEIGKASRVYLSELKPQGVKNDNSHRRVSVEIKFKATMKNLLKFIYEIERSPLLLRVNSLQLIPKADAQYPLEGSIKVSGLKVSS